jgi:hypothetical protein
MIKVLRHGNTIEVVNPVDGSVTRMINVTFVEEGRGGADKGMAETTAFLSQITGQNVGLSQLRTHTHPIKAELIGQFPLNMEMPGHINRGLFSTPQINQQLDKEARLIDGKPTYFKTWISATPEEDKDYRIDVNVMAQIAPAKLFTSNVGAARVRVVETRSEGPQGSRSNTDLAGETHAPASVLSGVRTEEQQGGQG